MYRWGLKFSTLKLGKVGGIAMFVVPEAGPEPSIMGEKCLWEWFLDTRVLHLKLFRIYGKL